jgi:hypothetical protein
MEAKTRAQLFAELANPPEIRWKQDPAGWARARAGIDLWSKQKQIIESVRDNSKTAVHSCHEIGKSFVAATTVCWWLDVHPAGEAFVVTTAPTGPQVKAILWREINRIHRRANLRGRTNLTEWYVGQELVAYGRKPSDYDPYAFQGLHARFFLVVLDEACGIPKSLWDSASTLAANEHSRTLAIGNPDDPNGEFAENCQPGSSWAVIKVGYRETPNFTGEAVAQHVADSLIHPTWVEDRRIKWGEESALFQSKCEGIFPTVGSPWQVIPYAWITACKYLDYPAKKPIEAGVDVGATHDRTVVTVRAGARVVLQHVFVNPDPMLTVGEIAAVLREYQVECVKVDSIGIGWGVYGRLRELSTKNNPTSDLTTHDANVVPINVSLAPTLGNEHVYYNRRTEMWWLGREHARLRTWDLSGLSADQQDELIRELSMPEYEIVDSQGKVRVESNEKVTKRLGASPDLATSLLLAYVPASWAGELRSAGLLSAPSLLDSMHPGDLANSSVGYGQRMIPGLSAGMGGGLYDGASLTPWGR